MILLVAANKQKQDAIPSLLIIIYHRVQCIKFIPLLHRINLSIQLSGNPKPQLCRLCRHWDKSREKQLFFVELKSWENFASNFWTTLSHFLSVFVGSEENYPDWKLQWFLSLYLNFCLFLSPTLSAWITGVDRVWRSTNFKVALNKGRQFSEQYQQKKSIFRIISTKEDNVEQR